MRHLTIKNDPNNKGHNALLKQLRTVWQGCQFRNIPYSLDIDCDIEAIRKLLSEAGIDRPLSSEGED